MPSALTATGFHDAVEYKVVTVTSLTTGTDVQKHVTGGPGKLLNVYIDGGSTTADFWVKIFDGANPTAGTDIPQIILKCVARLTASYQIPYGIAFTELGFWATASANQTNTSGLTGSASVTLTCS